MNKHQKIQTQEIIEALSCAAVRCATSYDSRKIKFLQKAFQIKKNFTTSAEIPVCIWRKGKCIARDESDMAYPEKSLQKRSVLERLLQGCLLHVCDVGFDLPMGCLLLPQIRDCRFASSLQQGIKKSEDCVHFLLHHAIQTCFTLCCGS